MINNLNPVIFIVPLIALLLTVVMFFILLQKVDDKAAFKRYVLFTLVLSFLLNLAWEIIQMPLYKDASFNIQHIAFCGLASVADAIMVLLIYFVLALIYKDPLWIKHLNLRRTLFTVLIGSTGAVLAEIRHLSEGNWDYASSMPIVPFVNVGLSPVLQFMFLPVLSYYLSFYFLKKNYGS
jgi:hypothetical protein